MFGNNVHILIENVEGKDQTITDADLQFTLDTGDVDVQATTQAVSFSRKVHYLLANLTTGSAMLFARQNEKLKLPDATRYVSLFTQLLDLKLNPSTFEQDFKTWWTVKTKYDTQSGTALPDSVSVATLLTKRTRALQSHLRLNARTLTTYAQMRAVIVNTFVIVTSCKQMDQHPWTDLKEKENFSRTKGT